MNLLPHSNGVRRVNMKRQRTTKEKLKYIAKVLLGIIIDIKNLWQINDEVV